MLKKLLTLTILLLPSIALCSEADVKAALALAAAKRHRLEKKVEPVPPKPPPQPKPKEEPIQQYQYQLIGGRWYLVPITGQPQQNQLGNCSPGG